MLPLPLPLSPLPTFLVPLHSQEGRVTIVNAKVEVARGKVDNAIAMLQSIGKTSPHHPSARSQLAALYLEHRNDRHAYAECHEELVRASPTPGAYVVLGEAYMNISEPEKAVEAFEAALRKSPGDAALASRIGKVRREGRRGGMRGREGGRNWARGEGWRVDGM